MTPQDSVARYQLEERAKSGARWFYWIAALSLITSFVSLAGGKFGFVVSLGVTQVIDGVASAVAAEAGWGFRVVARGFGFVAAGLFAPIGYFASERYGWVCLAGRGLDALVARVYLL